MGGPRVGAQGGCCPPLGRPGLRRTMLRTIDSSVHRGGVRVYTPCAAAGESALIVCRGVTAITPLRRQIPGLGAAV